LSNLGTYHSSLDPFITNRMIALLVTTNQAPRVDFFLAELNSLPTLSVEISLYKMPVQQSSILRKRLRVYFLLRKRWPKTKRLMMKRRFCAKHQRYDSWVEILDRTAY